MNTPNDAPAITTNSIIVATRDQVSSDLSVETILLSLRSGMYYGLQQVGTRIWELAREPIRVADIRDTITGEYDVEPERCERDILAFLQQLATEGLIEVRDGPAGD
jgi:hypothetical protein